MKQILGAVRRADCHFNMINEGDKIAVGLSGGKDSVLLLYALNLYRFFKQKPFELIAITVDLGFEPGGFDTSLLKELCDSLEIPFFKAQTNIGKVVFETRKEKNPCALCAKLRKGAFYKIAKEQNANKSAYAHHRDDALETFLMSMLYEGRLNTLAPVSYLSRSDITLIRPFIYLSESKIISEVANLNLPVVKNPCPASGNTKREEIKALIENLSKQYPNFKDIVFSSLANTASYNLWDKYRV